jgi:hypothetical protein
MLLFVRFKKEGEIMRRIRVQLYILVVVALVLISCTAGPANTGNTTQSSGGKQAANVVATQTLATTPSGATDTPSLPTPVGSFVYPTPIPTQQAVETMMAQRAAEGTPTPITPESKITPALAKAMKESPNDIQFYAFLTQQASLSDTSNMTDSQRRENAYNSLRSVADQTQPAVEGVLNRLQQTGQVSRYKAYWLYNSFLIEGTAKAVEMLAERDDIKQLDLYVPSSIPNEVKKVSTPDAQANNEHSSRPAGITPTPEWNISLIAAPTAWAEGYKVKAIRRITNPTPTTYS